MQTPSSTETVENISAAPEEKQIPLLWQVILFNIQNSFGTRGICLGSRLTDLSQCVILVMLVFYVPYICDFSSALCMPHTAAVLTVLKGRVDSWRKQRIKMSERSRDGH